MTLSDLARAARRLWWLTLVGLLLTAAAAAAAARAPGVYWSQVNVVFLDPAFPASPNALSHTPTRAIEVASVIQREVNGVDVAHVVSDGVTIVDEGVRSGTEVRLPNAGGQWANNFNRPWLDVVVVDTTAQAAQARLTAVLEKIDAAIKGRQAAAGVVPGNEVTTQLTPQAPQIRYAVGLSRRAGGAAATLGLGLTLAGVVLLDGPLARRARRRRGTAPAGALEHRDDPVRVPAGV